MARGRIECQRLAEAAGAHLPRVDAAVARKARRKLRGGIPQRRGGSVQPARKQGRLVARVAAERLVAAVAVERHRDVSSRHPSEVEGRHGGGVGERLAVVAHDPGQRFDRVGLHDQLVVVGREPLRDQPRQRPLVELGLEADAERLHRFAGGRRHLGHDRCRVQAARQERAERDVGDHPAADGAPHVLAQCLERLLIRGERRLTREVKPPVALDTGAAVFEHESVAGR